MQVCEYIVNRLIENKTSHAFGIPGGVILRLLDAMKNAEPAFTPHLCYNEQTAAFAAIGYAQASGRTGVAYATRGPGITNMVTAIAEAYQESAAVLFITAHGQRSEGKARFTSNQELDIVSCVSGFTKLAADIDDINDVRKLVDKALFLAQDGRKGPVLLDIAASLWNKDIPEEELTEASDNAEPDDSRYAADEVVKKLACAKRPVILIGEGARGCGELYKITQSIGVPVLSSRGAQDILGGSPVYFGYVGSHGMRYSNFILSKADLIVSVGNRLAFPVASESYAPVMKRVQLVRVDIDKNELERHMPNETSFTANSASFFNELYSLNAHSQCSDWLDTCRTLKKELENEDMPVPAVRLAEFISAQNKGTSYVCDVGNNEFYFSRAYERSGTCDSVYCSRSYGTLGVSLGRAIGVHCATGGKVVCVTGDQGFQYNIQELEYIAHFALPVKIVLLNNRCSGMIADHEKTVLGGKRIHVDSDNGYSTPDFEKIVRAYGIDYTADAEKACTGSENPVVYEISYASNIGLTPSLPRGNLCQDMSPQLERERYERLDNM